MLPVITSWQHGAWIALDIFLVALLIYQVLVMIRGTRAVPMLVGLVVVAVTFYFARVGELTTLNWVVSHFLPYVVFALIVVFQSEIRHVLADLGRRFTFLRTSSSDNDAYDDIVLAANLFSQHQTGALIVIEREIGLRTHIESGVPLDARLSYDLLATVFRPSAPLHDGAVIVQKDRIAAAACFLPLSMNPLLIDTARNSPPRRYRHHRRDRCHRRDLFGRNRRDQPCRGRKYRARSHRGTTASPARKRIAAPYRASPHCRLPFPEPSMTSPMPPSILR